MAKQKQEEYKINWFAESKKKNNTRYKLKPSSVSFLGTNTPQRVNFLGLSKNNNNNNKVNFLGTKSKSYRMTPSNMFRKESIKKKKLSKWGDADMDGSPNYFDCDPRNAFKDQFKEANGNLPDVEQAAQQGITEVRENQSVMPSDIKQREIIKIVKSRIKRSREMKEEGTKEKRGGLRSALRRYAGMEGEEFPENKKFRELEKRTKQRKEDLTRLGENLRMKGMSEEQVEKNEAYKSLKGVVTSEEEGLSKYQKKVGEVTGESKSLMEAIKTPGLAGTLKYQRYIIEEKQARGKTPSKKELKALAKSELKAKKIGTITQEGKLSRELLSKIPVAKGLRILTGAGLGKGGVYTKEMRASSGRIRRMTATAAGAIFGPGLMQTRFDSEPRGRGRPPGPSGDYRIGGRPVYESDFQQYSAKQNALNRMLPSEQQSATINPEYVAYLKAKEAADRGEKETVMTEEGMPMEGQVSEETEGLPAMGTSMLQTGQQQVEMQERRAYNRATPNEVKAAQYQAQAVDNPLMAPNFMRGELKATGGSILTPIGPSILEAPQVFKGEMRNVTRPNPDEGEVKVGERPQTNPFGDEWLDIEIGSGKPVIRKRIRERWMTGEAL